MGKSVDNQTTSKMWWVWRDGPGGYRIYDEEFPTYDGGDPRTLGEPVVTGTIVAVLRYIEAQNG